MPRPVGHGPNYEVRRQEIIDSAARLFSENGYAGTGISDISAAANLGKGALYYYIGSKEQLLIEIQDRVISPLLTSAREIVALNEEPLVRLRLFSGVLIEIILRRIDYIRVYENDYRHLGKKSQSKLIEQRHQIETIVRSLIEAAILRGDIANRNPQLLMLQFLNMHNYTYQWAKPALRIDPHELSGEYCQTLFLGFGATSFEATERRATAVREARTFTAAP